MTSQPDRDTLVVPLRNLDLTWLAQAGGKAAQLGVLFAGGLPVPEGFAVTTAAFRRGLDDIVAAAILAASDALGPGPVAVRSSATAEDLPQASFAGQQDTFLNVSAPDALLDAVRRCWQSLYSERAIAYRREHAIAEDGVAMAVVVQRMVDARCAGVLFTLNPVSGALDELVIEAARGLGDQVVSARVTPCRYRLRRRAPHDVLEAEGADATALFPLARLDELARLGLAAERLLGRAADVEWAFDGDRLWLLQARAVTAAGPPRPSVEYGSRWNEEACRGRLTFWSHHNFRETMPYPHTPFSWSFWKYLLLPQAAVLAGIKRTREDQFWPAPDLVDGRIHWNLNVFVGLALGPMAGPLSVAGTRLVDAEVAGLLRSYLRSGELRPARPPRSLRRRLRILLGGLFTMTRLMLRSKPEHAWQSLRDCRDEVASFRKIDLPSLSDEQILALARYFADENLPRIFEALLTSFFAVPALAYLHYSLPRWGFSDALPRLLSGLPGNPTLETALALWDIAERAGAGVEVGDLARAVRVEAGDPARAVRVEAGDPARAVRVEAGDLARAVRVEAGDLARPGVARPSSAAIPHSAVRDIFLREDVSRLPAALAESAAGRAFLADMQEFLRQHGHRAVREFDFSCPRWRDDPTFLYETLRNYLSHPPGELTPRQHYEQQGQQRLELVAAIEQRLAWRPLRRFLFRRALRSLESRMPLREAFKFYGMIGLAHIRDLYLEVGRRMAARGQISSQDEFFFLSIPELEQIAEGQRGPNGEFSPEWVKQQIPLRRLEFARQMRANPPLVVRSDGKPAVPPVTAGECLRGTAISWGTARGPARILLDPGDGARLHKGEVLVAPFTDPGWTPLFLTAGALVMEVGGIISHGAMVAREYGIPGVVGVKDATRILRDGEIIEVNGSTGDVRRLRV